MNKPAVYVLLAAFLTTIPAKAGPINIESLDVSEVLENFQESRSNVPFTAPKAGPVPPPISVESPDMMSGRFDSAPEWDITPGVLCTKDDKDFKEYRYRERIPYCRRNLSIAEKKEVSKWYDLRWEDHSNFQYDHLLSLCLGGSNNLHNIWPMPWDEARQKARLENNLCIRLRNGNITQKAAIREELGWFAENAPHMLKAFKALVPS